MSDGWLLIDGGSLKRPYEPSPYDSQGHPVKSATGIADSTQPGVAESQMNIAINQQQIMFQTVPDTTPVTVGIARPTTCAVVVSTAEPAVKQEIQSVISSTPLVLPAVTPSLVPIPVTYATGVLKQPAVGAAVGGLQLTGHNVDAGAAGHGYVTNTVSLNPSVIQFLQQQQQSAVHTGGVPQPGNVHSVTSPNLTRNTVGNILAAAAAQKTVLQDNNTNIQMLMNLLNCGVNKAPVQWAPVPAPPAHSSNVPQTNSPFIVQNFTTVAAVPQDLSSQLVFSLNRNTSFTESFTAPSVVSYGTSSAAASSVLLATPAATGPQLAHSLTANDQVLNLALHSSGQHMDIHASESYPARMYATQASSFPHVEPTAFVASPGEKTQGYCNVTPVSVTATTYAEPMGVAAHFASDTQPPPAKTMICMTNSGADTVSPVLVHPHDPHNFSSNMIVHMDVASHPPAKREKTSPTELPHEINPTGMIGGSLEPSSLFLTGNNPMLAETSSQPQSQNTVDMQGFSSQPVLGMDICNGHLTDLEVAAEPAALNVASSPTDESSANSMSSNLQQSLAELLDLQQQINAVGVSAAQSVQPSAVLDSPLTRELPAVPSESMQWVSSTTSHGLTTTTEAPPAASSVVLAPADVGTINLLTAAEVLGNTTYGQEANHEVFYSPQPATSYAVVIGSAGNSQQTSTATWSHEAMQSPYAAGENTHKEIKQEQMSGAGDVVLDLLSTMSTAAGRPTESQLYTQQPAAEVPSDFTTLPVTSSSALTGTTSSDGAQSVFYVVNQVAVDSARIAQEPGTQPITYLVTTNQLPTCNQSQDIGLVQYATPQQIQPAAGSDVHSPTSSGFRVLAADTIPPTSTDQSPSGIQFQLSQPMSFGSK